MSSVIDTLLSRTGAQLATDVRERLRSILEEQGEPIDLSGLDATKPILLLPLRIETRFKDNLLWVRIFPDALSVDQHQPLLTEAEEAAGARFVQATGAAAGEETRLQAAWAELGADRAPERAAWVARACEAATGQPAATRAATSTAQPVVRTLPEQFAFTTVSALVDPNTGKPRIRSALGKRLPEEIAVGPDPGNPTKSLLSGDDGSLQLTGDIEWLADFNAAVEAGMACRVGPLEGFELSGGFAQVLVLGVRRERSALEQKAEFEALLQAHRYSDGLAFVPQGTSTNNPGEEADGREAPPVAALASAPVNFPDGTPAEPDFQDFEDDGTRLARLLGIDPGIFADVPGAHAREAAEAIAMKRALWSGTLGHYLFDMIPGVLSDETIVAVRRFFTRFVFGRGPLAALRAGEQPYGIIPSARFDTLALGDGSWRFENELRRHLWSACAAWDARTGEVAHIGRGGDPERTLTDILRQHPAGVTFGQTRLVDEAYRKASQQINGMPLTVVDGTEARLQLIATDIVAALRTLFPGLAILPSTKLLTLAERWRDFNPRLEGHLVDSSGILSETKPLAPVFGDKNYLDWLLEADVTDVVTEQLPEGADTASLLYQLLRFSYLVELGKAADLIERVQNPPPAGVRSPAVDLFQRSSTTAELEAMGKLFVFTAGQPPVNLPDLMAGSRPTRPGFDRLYRQEIARLVAAARGTSEEDRRRALTIGPHEFFAGLNVLRSLPTARLERLVAEHVDLLASRLDAWMTGLVYLKALSLRTTNDVRLEDQAPAYSNERQGLYLGAYGYVENLRPRPRMSADATKVPAALRSSELLVDAATQGVVHAPSLDHAATAAILKSGERARREQTASPFKVNLSSRRVRLAEWLCDGMRNGQPLGALLGYLFERRLHDAGLATHTDGFRRAFPTYLERGTTPTPGAQDQALAPRNVVDGLALLQQRDAAVTLAGADRQDRITRIVDDLADALDAVGDLFVAEGVHQLVKGNIERAAGVLDASGRASYVPQEFEVAATPRSGRPQVHRLGIAFDADADGTSPWTGGAPTTPRARLEPVLNAWLGRALGNPAGVGAEVTVTARLADGSVTTRTGILSLVDLGLEPIDLFLAFPEAPGAAAHEIALRFARRILAGERLEVTDIKLAPSSSLAPLADLAPMVRSLRTLVLGARPLQSSDFAMPGEIPARHAQGFDLEDLDRRILALRDEFTTAGQGLEEAIASAEQQPEADGPEAEALAAAIEAAQQPIALLGMPDALPPLTRAAGRAGLLDAADSGRRILALLKSRIAAGATASRVQAQAETEWPGVPPAPEEGLEAAVNESRAMDRTAWASARLEALRALAGSQVVFAPCFTPPGPGIAGQIGSGGLVHDEPVDPVETWLLGLSVVRPQVAAFVDARMVAPAGDAASALAGRPLVLQLPPGEHSRWCALPLRPGEEPAPEAGTVTAMVMLAPSGLTPGRALRGILVDEWVEVVPDRRQTTGVAFNFDRPTTEPPQVMILAIAPQDRWDWRDLVDTVTETFAASKRRLVVPALRRDEEEDPDADWDLASALTHFLPAIVTPFRDTPGVWGLDLTTIKVTEAAQSLARFKAEE